MAFDAVDNQDPRATRRSAPRITRAHLRLQVRGVSHGWVVDNDNDDDDNDDDDDDDDDDGTAETEGGAINLSSSIVPRR